MALLKRDEPLRRAALATIATAMALLLLTRKPYYPHYFQPALPFLFVGLGCLWSQHASRRARALVVALATMQALGSLDALWTITHRLDGLNGLRTQRSILARIVSDGEPEGWPPDARIELSADFRVFPESYEVLGRRVLGTTLTFVAPGSPGMPTVRYQLSRQGDAVSVRRLR
jgi:hypothetical protein